MSEVLIPPWINPQTETSTLVDDSTSVFRAAYAPGVAQRVSYVEPRLQVKQHFQNLRGAERSAMLALFAAAKGKFATVRAIVGYALQGSFPTAELLANNTFASGTSGWTASGGTSIAVINRMLRATALSATALQPGFSRNATVTPYSPYVARAMLLNQRNASPALQAGENAGISQSLTRGLGLNYAPYTSVGSTVSVQVFSNDANGSLAGSYIDVPWLSHSRCALVDNAPNLLLQSRTQGTSPWSLFAATATANGTAPDGTATSVGLKETATTGAHGSQQSAVVPNPTGDYCFSAYVQGVNRGFCVLQVSESGGATSFFSYFNLSTGAAATSGAGANWTNVRTASVSMGNGWFRLSIIARKTNSGTTLVPQIAAATADGTSSYLGTTSDFALTLWDCALSQSSVPMAVTPTIASAAAAAGQTGNTLNAKGLPVSTAGILYPGDMFEIGGELKIVSAQLDSDASGLGMLQFGPAICRSPLDNDAIVIAQPFGKFIFAADASWQNDYGVYLDCDITLEAINE